MMSNWAERIPQAIEKAVGNTRYGMWCPDLQGLEYITAGEVALAKALWEEFFEGQEPQYANNSMERPLDECDTALRAFVEKVEAL